jgi:hypothetical protein
VAQVVELYKEVTSAFTLSAEAGAGQGQDYMMEA